MLQPLCDSGRKSFHDHDLYGALRGGYVDGAIAMCEE
jgi:hypothetical protein